MVTILIATQKETRFPRDSVYIPIQAGASLGIPLNGMLRDNTGDQISEKNRNYCELTAIYWAWKNLKSDYIGLNHYRRYFSRTFLAVDKYSRIATTMDIEQALKEAPVLLPRKTHYFIETNYTQYAHAHHIQDLELTREILDRQDPDSVAIFDAVMGQTSGHRFNMFVMRKDLYEQYCSWLFPVLFELESRLDIIDYSDYDKRVFGFVAERLMDVWINRFQITYTELPVVFTERQNWFKKGGRFLLRKLRGSNC